MGIVLLISLVTMPVVIVNTLSRSYRTISFTAPLVAVAANVAGLVASYNFEVPPAAIIFTLTLTLIIVKLLSLRSKIATRRSAENHSQTRSSPTWGLWSSRSSSSCSC